MNLATLGMRTTDVIVAGLKLPRRFTLAEMTENYGGIKRARNEPLAANWTASIRNELQRLSSDCKVFAKENRKLDLISFVDRRGLYTFRDEARSKLLDAANRRPDDLLITQNTLVVPIDIDAVASAATNHLVGAYAQQKIMMAMRSRGYEILQDSSRRHSYDFTFCGTARYDTVQTMECKGSRRADLNIVLTQNEMRVAYRSRDSYWVGVVYGIEIVNGRAVGGTDPFITDPPVLEKWAIAQAVRLRRIPDAPVQQPGLFA